jgi:hypothetical protein
VGKEDGSNDAEERKENDTGKAGKGGENGGTDREKQK